MLKEGDPLPSVSNVAAEFRVNPLTVMKGYQQLVDEGLVESRRGLGMFINAGARKLLLQGERQKFLAEEWPRVHATIDRLGLTPEELDAAAKRRSSPENARFKSAESKPRKEERWEPVHAWSAVPLKIVRVQIWRRRRCTHQWPTPPGSCSQAMAAAVARPYDEL